MTRFFHFFLLAITMLCLSQTSVMAQSCYGTATMQIAIVQQVAVITAPTTAICQGQSVTLSANTGSGLTYQWKLNNQPIANATASTYNAMQAGSYTCEVTGVGTATSNTIQIEVNTLPSSNITAIGSTSICVGGSVALQANTGNNLTYQWLYNNTPIPNQTSASYTANANGTYAVVVTNATSCSTTSTPVQVNVAAAPSASITPSGATSFCTGGNVALQANTGNNLTYQWLYNNTPIPNQTSGTYTANANGNYAVVVTNAATCSATSTVVQVNVAAAPSASITPSGATSFCTGGSVALQANTGNSLTYQWLYNNTPIPNQTSGTYTANANGTYAVVVTNAATCSATSTPIQVNVAAAPSASITPSGATSFCTGGSVALQANTGNSLTYQWLYNNTPIPNQTSGTYTANANGNYAVVVTNATTCSATSTPIQVNVAAAPSASITPSGATNFCTGGSVALQANTGNNLTYQWLYNNTPIPNQTSASYTANANGNYAVVVTNAATCSATSTVVQVNVTAAPSASITPSGATNFCTGGSVALQANPGNNLTYQWLYNNTPIPNQTSASYTANANGNYAVVVTNATSCSTTSTPIQVNVAAAPSASITPSGATNFCTGGSVALQANTGNNLTYQWLYNNTPIPNQTSGTYTANANGNYAVVVTNATSCSTTSTPIQVNVTAAPSASITPSGATNFCTGGSVALQANTGNNLTYQWLYNNTPIPNQTSGSYTANANGNYAVVVTNATSCSATSTPIQVNVAAAPSASITPSGATSFCTGGSVALQANTGNNLTYQWLYNNTPIPNQTSASYTANANGNYAVVVTNATTCSATSTPIQVNVAAAPSASITPSGATNFCTGGSVALQANTGNNLTYQWLYNNTPIPNQTSGTYTANANGNYAVVVTNATTCSATSTPIQVNVAAAPSASITPSGATNFCTGGSVALQANTGNNLTYQWLYNNTPIPNQTSGSYTANANGNYAVVVTNATSCSATSTPIQVNVAAAPSASITPSGATNFCTGGSVALQANTGNNLTYQWLYNNTPIPNQTSASYTANANGTYAVVVTNAATCSATSTPIQVNVSTAPSASITPSGATNFCTGGSVALQANTGNNLTYQWLYNNTPIPNQTSASYTANANGNYAVVVTNATTCSATSTPIQVNVSTAPSASITPSGATSFCTGGNVALQANTGNNLTYQWLYNNTPIPNQTSGTYTANANGNYAVVVTNAATCSATSTPVQVNVAAAPSASITPSGATSFCTGGSVALQANTGNNLTYQWLYNNTPIPNQTSGSYTANANGTYAVVVTNATTCSATSTPIQVNVAAAPSASITPSGATNFCTGGSVALQANTGNNLTYQWLYNNTPIPNQTSASYTANANGTYAVVVTNATSCSTTSTPIQVNVAAAPSASITPSGATSFCTGGNVALQANTGNNLTYQWLYNNTPIPNQTSASYTANANGNYAVVVTNAATCSATSTVVQVNVAAAPSASITPSGATNFCTGGSVALQANTGNNLTYQWLYNNTPIPNQTSGTYTANANGTYAVVVTNAASCSATSTAVQVNVAAAPSASITPSGATNFCTGGSVALQANTGNNLTYQWLYNNTPIPNQTSASYTANANGNYAVVVTNAASCSATSTPVQVNVAAAPSASITPSGATNICEGGVAVLQANVGNGLTYQWTQNGGAIPNQVGPNYGANTTGDYSVVVTNNANCSATASPVFVTVNPNPTAEITAQGPTSFCSYEQVTLSANGGLGYTYQWLQNGTPLLGGITSLLDVELAGQYTVIVTSAVGCSATSLPLAIQVYSAPSAVITANGPTTFCAGGGAMLTANIGAGLSYQWVLNNTLLDGATSVSLLTTETGGYSVLVTNQQGCETISPQTNVTELQEVPTPTISQQNNQLISSANFGNQWYLNGAPITNATGATFTPTITGNYTVVVTQPNGCSVTSSVYMFMTSSATDLNESPTISIYPNPSNGIFQLQVTGEVTGDITIFDIQGRTIYQAPIGTQTIDLQVQSVGSYLALIKTSHTTYYKKLIIYE